MGNLIWTSILYFSTFGIVFVTYRVFVEDRKADKLGSTQELIKRAYQNKPDLATEIPLVSRRNRA